MHRTPPKSPQTPSSTTAASDPKRSEAGRPSTWEPLTPIKSEYGGEICCSALGEIDRNADEDQPFASPSKPFWSRIEKEIKLEDGANVKTKVEVSSASPVSVSMSLKSSKDGRAQVSSSKLSLNVKGEDTPCTHKNLTKSGTNQHRTRLTCKDCHAVLDSTPTPRACHHARLTKLSSGRGECQDCGDILPPSVMAELEKKPAVNCTHPWIGKLGTTERAACRDCGEVFPALMVKELERTGSRWVDELKKAEVEKDGAAQGKAASKDKLVGSPKKEAAVPLKKEVAPPVSPTKAAEPAKPQPAPSSKPAKTCKHEKLTSQGSNQYVVREKCVDCGEVVSTAPTPCKHANKTKVGSNQHWVQEKCKDCGEVLAKGERKQEVPAAPAVAPAVVPAEAPVVVPTEARIVARAIVPAVVPAVIPAIAPAIAPVVAPAIVPAAVPAAAPKMALQQRQQEAQVTPQKIVSPPSKVCKHEKTTTRGSNQYYRRETCVDCGELLSKAPTPCKHKNITRQGSNQYIMQEKCKDCGELLSKVSRLFGATMLAPKPVDERFADEGSEIVSEVLDVSSVGKDSAFPLSVHECPHLHLDRRGTNSFREVVACKDCGLTQRNWVGDAGGERMDGIAEVRLDKIRPTTPNAKARPASVGSAADATRASEALRKMRPVSVAAAPVAAAYPSPAPSTASPAPSTGSSAWDARSISAWSAISAQAGAAPPASVPDWDNRSVSEWLSVASPNGPQSATSVSTPVQVWSTPPSGTSAGIPSDTRSVSEWSAASTQPATNPSSSAKTPHNVQAIPQWDNRSVSEWSSVSSLASGGTATPSGLQRPIPAWNAPNRQTAWDARSVDQWSSASVSGFGIVGNGLQFVKGTPVTSFASNTPVSGATTLVGAVNTPFSTNAARVKMPTTPSTPTPSGWAQFGRDGTCLHPRKMQVENSSALGGGKVEGGGVL
ncbi:hypothetical protein HDU96_002768 [Phlyctochytrium bullatum]|nr:hypothetical protein HDU96_002768 [Phlyctochytrium bullatum]